MQVFYLDTGRRCQRVLRRGFTGLRYLGPVYDQPPRPEESVGDPGDTLLVLDVPDDLFDRHEFVVSTTRVGVDDTITLRSANVPGPDLDRCGKPRLYDGDAG